MDVLVVATLDPKVLQWLQGRHSVQCAPELANEPWALRRALAGARGLIASPDVVLNADTLQNASQLRAIGLVGTGPENIDSHACTRAGIDLVRSPMATAVAEAEYMLAALLSLFRHVPNGNGGSGGSGAGSGGGSGGAAGGPGPELPGREIAAATVGLIGMTPATRALAPILAAVGARVVGYDPGVHASDALWPRWRIEPLPLRELMEHSDGVCVQLAYYSRYRGLLGERLLPFSKQDQVLVSVAPSLLFDEVVLAEAMRSGRIAGAWFDNMQPGALNPGRPLHGIASLKVTPRLAGATRESHVRSAWTVARRIDELMGLPKPQQAAALRPQRAGGPPDPATGAASA
jgi:D-3-phosphoglycerate dehydrogenase